MNRRSVRRSQLGRKGTSTDLMPSIMGAIDAIWENSKFDSEEPRAASPRKTAQAGSFTLSPNVQKILAHLPDDPAPHDALSKASSEESLKRDRRLRPHGDLEISANVQKMLSNLPDVELNQNGSFLKEGLRGSKSFCGSRDRFSKDFSVSRCSVVGGRSVDALDASGGRLSESGEGINESGEEIGAINGESDNKVDEPKPLGSYLQKSCGIASRTPAGRKNLGKYLQVPSESSVGTNSTASSEVSRPVSLTSLGSCSSSSSGGPHQPGSAYLASAESLDSDPEPAGSQGSADSGIAEQPTMSPEQCVLQEVMDTETVYVADLREVIEGYLLPWRNEPDCPLALHLQDLFSNLEEIYSFNRSFLEELQQANFNPTLTANAFLHNDAGFTVYSEYCTHYPRTMTVLSKLTADENMAALFRERQAALGHALPLGSYLLKPVQRILKYHLLLQRLSKQCDQPHTAAVDLALTTMTSVASHINTMKRKHEHAVRVQEIQSQLYGWTGPDLTALGELIAEGTFRIGGARGRRQIFLFDKVLLICKSKQDGCLAYKSHIMCANLMLVEQVRGEPLSFHVLPFDNPRQQCTLRARSPQHKREWTLQLKRVILENYSAVIPSHARQLVMQLGQNGQEVSEDSSDKWSPLKQHSTPQYLERRSRSRKGKDFANRRAASQDRSFASLTSWRRKSEPGINQYTSKTLPKRITKMKKTKDVETAKFYMDLSDSEACDIAESTDSLAQDAPCISEPQCEDIQESSLETEHDSQIASTTLEKVVSDLLMQNEEFQKLMNRQRRGTRDPESASTDELPSKADSLPRDFQLNDQLECKTIKEETVAKVCKDDSLLSVKQPDVEVEDLQESDISSQLNDSEHPDHRIYRKSTIRFSLVQRFRAIISEEQKRSSKLPTYMQGSENMGAKIAHPDYADPQKLFRSSQALSRSNLCLGRSNLSLDSGLDRSTDRSNLSRSNLTKSSLSCEEKEQPSQHFDSSHSDSYYEQLLEENLSEEKEEKSVRTLTSRFESKTTVKRPSVAPPPVPSKPPLLKSKENIETFKKRIFISKATYEVSQHQELIQEGPEVQPISTKGWVKTIVGRFE